MKLSFYVSGESELLIDVETSVIPQKGESVLFHTKDGVIYGEIYEITHYFLEDGEHTVEALLCEVSRK